MRYYSYLATSNELRIVKKKSRFMQDLIGLILMIAALTFGLVILFYFSLPPARRNVQTLVLLALSTGFILALVMKSALKKNNITIKLTSAGFSVNGEELGPLESIQSLLIEEYISSDGPSGVKTFKLRIDHRTITVTRGVDERDYMELSELLQGFLGIGKDQVYERTA